MNDLWDARRIPTDLLNDPRWELVERIAASRYFEKSAYLKALLRFVCERSLAGATSDLKEQQIGIQIFGRKPDYNPSDDNIVRVEARELRKRLQTYFSTVGCEEPILIEVPKGGYSAIFSTRPVPEPSEPAVPVPEPEAEKPVQKSMWRAGMGWMVATLCVLAAVGGWAIGASQKPVAASSSRVPRLWNEVFDPQHQTIVALADSNLVIIQDLLRHRIRLDDYIGEKYREKYLAGLSGPLQQTLSLIASRQYTSLADVSVSNRILVLNSAYADRTTVRFARGLQIRDFKSNNVVILGSSRSNPWLDLFEQNLNFIADYDPATDRPVLRNRSPKAGEPAEYVPSGPTGTNRTDYAVVALLPNLTRSGSVLIISGLTMEGTEAAGEMLSSVQLCERLLHFVGAAKDGSIEPFEVLLKFRAVAGASRDPEFVTFRRPTG